jgi:DNA-binding CsgD family transcriptional regulator
MRSPLIEAGHDPVAVVSVWAEALDLPVWISGPNRSVRYLNAKATLFFGRPAARGIGEPCWRVIGGRRARAKGLSPFCGPRCPLLASCMKRVPLEPIELSIDDSKGAGHWFRVLAFPLPSSLDEAPYLVHCGLPVDRTHRIEEYVRHIASRRREHRPISSLTRREREVVMTLARHEGLTEVADALHVSYVTVRNHVQHILAKLEVHSVQEAVAVYLLEGGEVRDGSRRAET